MDIDLNYISPLLILLVGLTYVQKWIRQSALHIESATKPCMYEHNLTTMTSTSSFTPTKPTATATDRGFLTL